MCIRDRWRRSCGKRIPSVSLSLIVERESQMCLTAVGCIEELIAKFTELMNMYCERVCEVFSKDISIIVKEIGGLNLTITNKQLQDLETHDSFLPGYILTLNIA
eukprot:TRINITY_DN11128_c0_g1_i4.p4 TRINITY_DN11128_c0_g1~~TRINITY_DN11128_c0_g1_i4.p4  ORF type:complete len:104 (+),score=19.78 TRINITY_DN11128_c0_g1_i4:73-384(+)